MATTFELEKPTTGTKTKLSSGAYAAIVLGILLLGVGVVIALYLTGVFGDYKNNQQKKVSTGGAYAQRAPVPLRPRNGAMGTQGPNRAPPQGYGTGNTSGVQGPPETQTFQKMQADLARARAAQDESVSAYRCAAAPSGLSAVDPGLAAALDQTGTLPKLMHSIQGDSLGHVMTTPAKPTAINGAFHDGDLHLYDPKAANEVDLALKASTPSNWNLTDAEAQAYKTEQMARAIMLESNPDPSVDDVLASASVMIATRDMIRRAINTESQLAIEAVSCQAPLRFQYKGPLERTPLPLPIVDPFVGEGTITPGLENYLCEIGCGRTIVGGV